jgi:hypothetical protein
MPAKQTMTEWLNETFQQAAKGLSPELQLKLQEIETEIREDMEADPALGPLYAILGRQLRAKKEHASMLYPRLAAHRSAAEKAKEKARTGSSEETVTVSGKRRSEGGTGVEPKPAPPIPPTTPRTAPTNQQGTKRNAHEQPTPSRAAKTAKTGYIPFEGDWKCGCCGFWNSRVLFRCRGNRGTCGAEAKDDSLSHVVQKEGLGIKKRVTGARWRGDWQCFCHYWNRQYWKECSGCKGMKENCCVGQDWDEELQDLPDYEGVMDDSKLYWTGYSRNESGGSYAQSRRDEMAAHLGVKGQFREKKNRYFQR